MPRDWLSRALDRADPETLAARLDETLARGAWAEVFELVRRLAPHRPYDVRLLNLGARAAGRVTDRDTPRRLQQAATWLQQALELAPGDVETLYQLGRMAYQRRLRDAAADYWRRAWTASTDDAEVREALLQLWSEDGALPDWGVAALEQMLLARHHDRGWELLLAHYRATGTVSANGHRLLLRRFQQGERAPAAVLPLARQFHQLDRFDSHALPIYLAAAEHEPRYRADVVRCDARLREFDPDRLSWYLAGVAAGEADAALLAVRGWRDGYLPIDDALPALLLAQRSDPARWHEAGLERGDLLQAAARALLADPRPTALPLLREALAAAPTDQDLLRAVAALLRPSLTPDAVEVYRRLFESEPGCLANTAFLATAIASGQARTEVDEAILTACLSHGGKSEPRVLAALAQRLAAAERDDDAALNWLRQAAEHGVAGGAEVWLARCEARRVTDDPAARERWSRLAADPSVTLEARVELATALAAAAATLPHLLQLGELRARAGAAATSLVELAAPLPVAEQARYLDRLARDRYRAEDWPAAVALTASLLRLRPDDPAARRKHLAATARLAMAGGGPWPEVAEDGALGAWLRAAAGEPVSDEALAASLRGTNDAVLRAAADVLSGNGVPALEPRTEAAAWLASLLADAAGGDGKAALRGLTAAEPRLWQAWSAGPSVSAALAVLRQTAPPWPALHPAAADLAAREAPWSALSTLLPRLSREQRLLAEVRRVAALAEAGDAACLPLLDDCARALPHDAADALRLAVAGTLGTPAALAAAPAAGPGADRVNWLRARQAWRHGEPAGPFLDRLPAALLEQPELAWTIALADASQASPALARSLRAHRDRLDLIRGLTHLALRSGDAARAAAWAAGLRGTVWAAPAETAIALVTEPWDEPGRWPARLARLAPEFLEPLLLALGAAALLAGRAAAFQPVFEGATARPATPELLNLQAALQLQSGAPQGALAALEGLSPLGPAGHHNAALAAAAADDPAAAWRHGEAALAARTDAPAPWQVAARRELAAQAVAAGQPERAVEHLEAALALRPGDPAALAAILPALLAAGRAADALPYSEQRLALAGDLAARLDHATVLASAEGAPAAAAWLAQLAADHPEAADAVAQRRAELAERLESALKARASEGDYHALFAAARDAAAIAPDDGARARALLQQVVALGRMADEGAAVARLERALSFCDEALALASDEDLRGHATRLRGQVVQRLAPALADQAEALLRARAQAWQALPATDAVGAADLAAAFGRVIDLVDRARGLGVEAVTSKLQALAEAASKLRLAAAARAGGKADG